MTARTTSKLVLYALYAKYTAVRVYCATMHTSDGAIVVSLCASPPDHRVDYIMKEPIILHTHTHTHTHIYTDNVKQGSGLTLDVGC